MRPEGRLVLETWLVKEGYTYERASNDYMVVELPTDESPTPPTFNPPSAQIDAIHNLVRIFGEPAQVHRIQLIVVSVDPIQHILNNFHSSTSSM